MPMNKEKNEEYQARKAIDKMLSICPDKGMDVRTLVRQVLLAYEVSESMPLKFIKKYYVDTKEYYIEENTIKKVKE